MNLRLHRLAVAEIDHEVDYYESRQTGLGAELEDELGAVPDVIGDVAELLLPQVEVDHRSDQARSKRTPWASGSVRP